MKKTLALVLTLVLVISTALTGCGTGDSSGSGKTISVIGDSISTFQDTSNGSAADTTNSTIRINRVYYPSDKVKDVTLNDTWWMQVVNDLGLRLLVNNSWSGSALLRSRSGASPSYEKRCVQLHDDTGDNAGETPDIIAVALGTNDFDDTDTLGTADINYANLIEDKGDGTYTYAKPATSLEAAAILLHKISVRYPDAEVYYLTPSHRINGKDEYIAQFSAELKKVVEHFGAYIVDIYNSAITVENFSTYMGDNNVHPNKLGMDVYTEAFKRAYVANTKDTVNYHTVSFDLGSATVDYGDNKIVLDGTAFTAELQGADGAKIHVTMDGTDITSSAYSAGTIHIKKVTGDVVIRAEFSG